MQDIGTRRDLYGDWRKRIGNTTPKAHLYPPYGRKPSQQPLGVDKRYPMCGARVPLGGTSAVRSGMACTECVVMAITHPERLREPVPA